MITLRSPSTISPHTKWFISWPFIAYRYHIVYGSQPVKSKNPIVNGWNGSVYNPVTTFFVSNGFQFSQLLVIIIIISTLFAILLLFIIIIYYFIIIFYFITIYHYHLLFYYYLSLLFTILLLLSLFIYYLLFYYYLSLLFTIFCYLSLSLSLLLSLFTIVLLFIIINLLNIQWINRKNGNGPDSAILHFSWVTDRLVTEKKKNRKKRS